MRSIMVLIQEKKQRIVLALVCITFGAGLGGAAAHISQTEDMPVTVYKEEDITDPAVRVPSALTLLDTKTQNAQNSVPSAPETPVRAVPIAGAASRAAVQPSGAGTQIPLPNVPNVPLGVVPQQVQPPVEAQRIPAQKTEMQPQNDENAKKDRKSHSEDRISYFGGEEVVLK